MLKELYVAALGMQNQKTRLEVMANNMANASTAGFKRSSVFERNLQDSKANFNNVPGDVEQNDPPVGQYIDFSPGAFEQTSNKLDVALENEGFFVLQDDKGNEVLTRQGRFNLDTDGYIIATDGKKLLGTGGPLRVDDEFFTQKMTTEQKKSIEIKISQNGDIYANEIAIGSILTADVNDKDTLRQVSAADFVATKDTEIIYLEPDQNRMRQGWLENSNVNIISEMVSMIELQRMFEAGSKVIKTNEDTLGDSIQMGRYY